MQHSLKSWYSQLLKLSRQPPGCGVPEAGNLRSVQYLIAEPDAQIHQIFNRQRGPLVIEKKCYTEASDLALYFSGICPCENFNLMPIVIILRIDWRYVSRALAWSCEQQKAIFANMTITSRFSPGLHAVSLEALNRNITFDRTSEFNLTIIEL